MIIVKIRNSSTGEQETVKCNSEAEKYLVETIAKIERDFSMIMRRIKL